MIAADVDVLLFRIIHIAAGVAWAGSLFLFVVFVQPSVAAIAPAGAPFMGELLGKRHLVRWLLIFGGLTIVGGAYLYWKGWQAAGALGEWISSSYGAILTVGAVAALIAYGIGLFVSRPSAARVLAIGRTIAASDEPPPAEIAEEMKALQGRLKIAARTSLGLLVLSVLTMATARYW
jgi:hypothetical protein